MSISTSSICNPASLSSGEGMSKATPHSVGSISVANGPADVRKGSNVVHDAWCSEIDGRLNPFDGPTEQFLDILVPCSTPYPVPKFPSLVPEKNKPGPFAKFHPAKEGEVKSYPQLIAGLTKLVDNFPKDKKLTFVNSHSIDFAFPFAAFAKNHHHSSPDIVVSWPGEALDENAVKSSEWDKIPIVLEVKPKESDDSFQPYKSGATNERTIIQVVRNARSLMHAHGFLFCFVIGVYGETVRIARFDHSSAIISPPFNIKRRADLLQRFFWHFVHPLVEGPVVGCDPTARRLCDDDKSWVKQCLDKCNDPDAKDPLFDENIRHGKRLLVQDEQTGAQSWYITYKLVDVNARLFSRATNVWRAIEDTRVMGESGRLIADKTKKNEVPIPKVRILKESWRQLVRKSEASFYQRLQNKIPDSKRHGLTKLECGADLGQLEVREWEHSAEPVYAAYMEGQRDLRLSLGAHALDPTASDASSLSSMFPPVPQAAAGTGTESSASDESAAPSDASDSSTDSPAAVPRVSIVDGREVDASVPTRPIPLPFPQHQTFSWAFACGPERSYRDRSHMRFIVTDVGRPITKFNTTRELILAMRDAIIGHRQAYEMAGILHRDVSVGNILIVDNPEGNSYTGFLHDFDYSSIVEELEDTLDEVDAIDESALSLFAAASGNLSDQDWSKIELLGLQPLEQVVQKERTGTYYFMALEMLSQKVVIHKPRHDLESFYWVLLWIILRHTLHNLSQKRCEEIFVYGKDIEAKVLKRDWISSNDLKEPNYLVMIRNNRPLTLLLRQFRLLVRKHIDTDAGIDYDSVLAIFDQALSMDGWPSKSEWVDCTLLDKPKTHGSLVNRKPLPPQAAPSAEPVSSEHRIPSLMETIRRSFKVERSKTKASAGSKGSQSRLLKSRTRSSGTSGPIRLENVPQAAPDTPSRTKRRKSEVDGDEGSGAEQVPEEEPVAGPSTLPSHDPKRRRTDGDQL